MTKLVYSALLLLALSSSAYSAERMLMLDANNEAVLRAIIDRATTAPTKSPTADARLTVYMLNLLDSAPMVAEHKEETVPDKEQPK